MCSEAKALNREMIISVWESSRNLNTHIWVNMKWKIFFHSTSTLTQAPSSRLWVRPSPGSPPENQPVRKKLKSMSAWRHHVFKTHALFIEYLEYHSSGYPVFRQISLHQAIAFESRVNSRKQEGLHFLKVWARLGFWTPDGHSFVSCLAPSSDKTEL